jgi:hypothetical protein
MTKFTTVDEAEQWCRLHGVRILPRTPDGLLVLDDGRRRLEAPLADGTWSTWRKTLLDVADRFAAMGSMRPPPGREARVDSSPSRDVQWSGNSYRALAGRRPAPR